MVTSSDALRRAVDAAQRLAERDRTSLLRRIQWTPPQRDFLAAVDPRPILLRTGNQWLGKSTVGAADTLHRCQGDHPYDPRGRVVPCAAGVVSPTDPHSIGLQEKVWELADKSTLAPGQAFIPGKGMRGRYPMLRFRNGSTIKYRTAKQGSLALSGDTLDHILLDELTPAEVYRELAMRVARNNGTMRLTLTPINAPADWLREECEAGRVVDMHYRCEPRWCIPVGSTEPLRDRQTGQPMDEAWLDRFIASMDPGEMEVRAHGGWQVVHVDRSFAAWSESLILPEVPAMPEIVDLAIGMDYGEAPGRFVIHLVAQTSAREVWVLGEWCGSGREGVLDAVSGIRGLLADWGLEMAHVRRWVGDINGAGSLGGSLAMNELMQRELRRIHPRVEVEAAFKTRGSVDTRFQMLNFAMSAGKLRVHLSCRRLLQSVRQHRKGNANAAMLKDPIDSLWYCAEPWIREVAPLPARVRIG